MTNTTYTRHLALPLSAQFGPQDDNDENDEDGNDGARKELLLVHPKSLISVVKYALGTWAPT